MEILRFVLAQVLSIHGSGRAGLTLADKYRKDRRTETSLIQPAILYDKILPGAKGDIIFPAASKPCLSATALSTALLSRLSRVLSRPALPFEQVYAFNEPPPLGASGLKTINLSTLAADLKAAAKLQLIAALETLSTHRDVSDLERMRLLAAASVNQLCFEDARTMSSQSGADGILYDLIKYTKALASPALADADTLAAAMDGVRLFMQAFDKADHDCTLTGLALEALSRRTLSGLFALDRTGRTPVSLGRQFALMASLLKACPCIRREAVLAEVFSLFDRLYKTAFLEAANFLGHPVGYVLRYSGQALAAVLNCLWSLSDMSETDSKQQIHLRGLADTFAHAMASSFCSRYSFEIHGCLTKAKASGKAPNEVMGIGPLIPKYIRYSLSEQVFEWGHKGVIRLQDPLSLCLALTESVLERHTEAANAPAIPSAALYGAQIVEDADALIKLLHSLFNRS